MSDGCDKTHDLRLDPELDEFLRTARIGECRLVPWGSNYTFAVSLHDPDGKREEMIGIYKPRAGESPLWDFPSGTLYQREYAAFLLSRYLTWDFIPHTVVRDGPHGIGTLQLYVEPEDHVPYTVLQREHRDELVRIVAFDLVTNNADRKASHFFRGKQEPRLWGIDHGLTFHVHPKLRTVIWDFCGEPLPDDVLQALRRIYEEDDVRGLLDAYLEPLEIEALRARAARVVESGIVPLLSPRRNIPYGW